MCSTHCGRPLNPRHLSGPGGSAQIVCTVLARCTSNTPRLSPSSRPRASIRRLPIRSNTHGNLTESRGFLSRELIAHYLTTVRVETRVDAESPPSARYPLKYPTDLDSKHYDASFRRSDPDRLCFPGPTSRSAFTSTAIRIGDPRVRTYFTFQYPVIRGPVPRPLSFRQRSTPKH